jgi:diphosphomevalonate decarboxylase
MELARFEAQAPSNIAFIKYMGKTDSVHNLATNSSISYTLPNLLTTVVIEATHKVQAQWKPLDSQYTLAEGGIKKFLVHWDRCHQRMAPGFKSGVTISSGNNFPSDCGLASSASSFAALTLAAFGLFQQTGTLERDWRREELAQLSREGSGSSVRSFFGPWTYWCEDEVKPIESVWGSLLHSVIVVDATIKKVSSSEAHQRVLSSSLFEGRIQRAEKRSQHLQNYLKRQDSWSAMYELAWSEFWDMHLLFETSSPAFYYMTPTTLLALRYLQDDWERRGDGPLITMDAGPNIHLLYRPEQSDLRQEHKLMLANRDVCVLTGFN